MEKKKRTKLKDRTLPDYTRGEEIFNMVSHIVGGVLAIAALVLCVIFSALKGDPWAVVASAVYGGTMVALYAMSSIYHGLTAERAKKVFQVIDHCTIYFLIAGTYTAITLAGIRVNHPVIAFVIFGMVWACCLGAATFTAIDLEKYKKMAMICYLGMGWCIILFTNRRWNCLALVEWYISSAEELPIRSVPCCMASERRNVICIRSFIYLLSQEVYCTSL